MKFSKELLIAIKAAKEAGKIALTHFKKDFDIEIKDDHTPVTSADKACDRKIKTILRKEFPNHSILSEELGLSGENKSVKWLVDPIAGTQNFIRHVPLFGVSVALEKNNQIVCGAIYFPTIKKLAFAEKNMGAFSDNKRIHVSRINEIKQSCLLHNSITRIVEKGCLNNFLKLSKQVSYSKDFGSPWPFLLVACGHAEIVYDTGPSPWCIAAAKIIVEEAGGKLTDFNGASSIYSGNALATNSLLHDKVLKIVKSA